MSRALALLPVRSPSLSLSNEAICRAAALLAVAAMAGWLAVLGRPLGPEGALRWWNGDLSIAHNSQHLNDGYSLLHLSFGALIYLLVRRFNPGLERPRLGLAVVLSAVTWEAIENLPSVIAMFNPDGQAASYAGDSIVNALGDVAFALVGLAAARRMSLVGVAAMLIGIELACAWLIGDGLIWGSLRLTELA